MGRNQNRIEGNYSIVSAFSTTNTPAQNERLHCNLIARALAAGLAVEELQGRWNGVDELSLRISGNNHVVFTMRMAREFSQEAYLIVSDGTARLFTCYTPKTFSVATTFTRIEEVTEPYPDNCSITRQGFAFRFF